MNQPQRTRPAPRMRTIAALALLAGLIPLAYVSPAERSLSARFRALSADASPAPDMARHPNLRYADLPGIDPNLLSLDIYAPRAATKCPVLVMIHGGGWRLGDKANRAVADLKSRHFVGQGYVFVSINYRLSPAVKHPTHVQDVARAIAWVHGNIARYGGDPARISVMGHSAGAHLAALVATDESYLDAEGKSLRILSGVILLDGAGYDLARHINDLGGGRGMRWLYEGAFGSDETAWRDASPVTHIAPDKGIPPFLVFHAGARITSATLSREFAEALAKAGIAARTVHAADKSHRTINADIGKPGDWVTLTIMGFLAGESPDKPRRGEASASARRRAPPPPCHLRRFCDNLPHGRGIRGAVSLTAALEVGDDRTIRTARFTQAKLGAHSSHPCTARRGGHRGHHQAACEAARHVARSHCWANGGNQDGTPDLHRAPHAGADQG